MNHPLSKIGTGFMLIGVVDGLIVAVYSPTSLAWAPILLTIFGFVLFIVGAGKDGEE